MIFLYFGNDRDAILLRARTLIEGLKRKKPDATVVAIDADNFTRESFRELVQSQSLFAGNSIIRCDGLLERVEIKDVVLKEVPQMASSGNIFILLEEKLLAAERKVIEQHAKELLERSKKDPKKGIPGVLEHRGGPYDVYAFANALAARDARLLWRLYHEGLAQGIAAEELYWKCIWQMRMLLLAKKCPTDMATLGVKDYPAQKAIKAASDWEERALMDLNSRLVTLYHEARRGKRDIEIGLEYVILSLS